MLVKRIISSVVILLIGLFLILTGGWVYTIGIALILASAAWEFIQMFRSGGYHPSTYIPVFGTIAITLVTFHDDPMITSLCFVLVVFSILISSLFRFRNNQKNAAIDMTIELASMVFVAFLGSHLIKIRFLPNGLPWIMASVFPACTGDIAAYGFGSILGKRKLSPRLSPKKTVEGYVSGVFTAILTGYVIGLFCESANLSISAVDTTILSGVVGLLSPFGDLSKSIVKRQFQLENTGDLIPGHGGVLDRIDSWLWAAPIAYYLIQFFFL